MLAKPQRAGVTTRLATGWGGGPGKLRVSVTLPGALSEALRSIVRRRTAVVGLAIILLTVLAALAAPVVAPYDPTEIVPPTDR